MNRLAFVVFTLLAVLVFLYIQKQYVIDPANIEENLSELTNEEISIIQSFKIEQTNSAVFIFKSSLTTGLAILTKHPFMDKLKVTKLQNDIEEKRAYIVTTNRGNYIVATVDLNDNTIVMEGQKSFEMKVLNEEFQLYISTSTIPKKYIDKDILSHVLINQIHPVFI